ncbi:MAG: acyl dehydratase [Pseudomonadota bacterium]
MSVAKATSQTIPDRIDPARAAAMHQVMARPGLPPGPGTALPAFWHQIYFWDVQPPGALGDDGHPATGTLIPDLGLPKRMWAGGRLTFHAPFLCAVQATRTTSLRAVTRKTGRTGELAFVTLRHEVRQRGGLVLSEDQDLVYRAADATPGDPPEPPTGGRLRETRRFDATTLFRYSALTMNGHRIHYDADYARSAEAYPGLVVHGPLLAQCLIVLAELDLGTLSDFSFRATAPVFAGQMVRFYSDAGRYWVIGGDDQLCMSAEAT